MQPPPHTLHHHLCITCATTPTYSAATTSTYPAPQPPYKPVQPPPHFCNFSVSVNAHNQAQTNNQLGAWKHVVKANKTNTFLEVSLLIKCPFTPMGVRAQKYKKKLNKPKKHLLRGPPVPNIFGGLLSPFLVSINTLYSFRSLAQPIFKKSKTSDLYRLTGTLFCSSLS